MPQPYLDTFLKKGHLRLSSFAQFAKHNDDERLDGKEGAHVVALASKDKSMYMTGGWGGDAYVLCGSLRRDAAIFDAFGSDEGFLVKSSMEFGLGIARCIPRFKVGYQGACVYKDGAIEALNSAQPHKGVDVANGKIDGSAILGNVVHETEGEVFFRKRERYQHQVEYRWLWFVEGKAKDYIDIEVPHLLNLCSKVTRPRHQTSDVPSPPVDDGCDTAPSPSE